jgi:hypothetical protein
MNSIVVFILLGGAAKTIVSALVHDIDAVTVEWEAAGNCPLLCPTDFGNLPRTRLGA